MEAQKLGIVADDLTGAMDSSGYFASRGFSTVVILEQDFSSIADVVVIDTNSRTDDTKTAAEKVRQAVKSLKGKLVYKKIDSTLRGNIGAELEAAMEEIAAEKLIMAPAFPAVGRTTVDGVLLVNGVSVAQTGFSHDPVNPVQEGHIPTLLEQSTKYKVACVGVEYIEAGPEKLYHKICEMPQNTVVCDVTKQSHLACIVKASALAEGRWLLCGSGGLARELEVLLPRVPQACRSTLSSLQLGRVLVVIGTRNEVAGRQLLRAKDELRLPIFNLDVEHLNIENLFPNGVARLVDEAKGLLCQGRGLALSSAFSQYVPALTRLIPAIMAEVVAGILDSQSFAGILLSGGDIAVEVCHRLSVAAILVCGEVEPGVPAGKLISGQHAGMRVVTKSGGFGTEASLVKSISYLEGGHLT